MSFFTSACTYGLSLGCCTMFCTIYSLHNIHVCTFKEYMICVLGKPSHIDCFISTTILSRALSFFRRGIWWVVGLMFLWVTGLVT